MKSLDRDEYWLLDLVHGSSFPLYLLTDSNLELIANRDSHGLSHAKLLDTLYRLFQDGSLVGIRYPNSENYIEANLTYHEIDDALQAKNDIQYQLTVEGGQQWEVLSKPNWDWCIGGGCYSEDQVISEATSRKVAEQYLQMNSYWDSIEVIPESIECELLRPWQATYWKTLSEGYKISCKIRKIQEIRSQQDMSPEEQEFMNHVWNWYTNPFKDK
jgi:hypothetical protein